MHGPMKVKFTYIGCCHGYVIFISSSCFLAFASVATDMSLRTIGQFDESNWQEIRPLVCPSSLKAVTSAFRFSV